MTSNNKPLSIIFNFLYSIASSVVGAIIASWPLLLIFMLIQKTNETVGLSLWKVMHNYNQLLWYLIWPFENKLKMDNFHTSVNAAAHFADCKRLFLLAIFVFIIGTVYWLFERNAKKRDVFTLSKVGTLFFLILPVVILPFAVTNFDSFFILFHHMFFSNSNWLFDPATDPIINVLTEGFFAACFAVAGLIYELFYASKLLK